MLIFLYGKDTYRSRQKLNEITDHYKEIHKSGLNLNYLDLKTQKFSDFYDKIRPVSMFKEKKLLVLKNSFLNKDFQQKFQELFKKFKNTDDIIVFYQEDEIAKNDSFFKFLKRNSKYQEFKLLKGQKLKDWLKKEFKKYDKNITEEALEGLIDFVGNDLWQLSNEIKKIASYNLKNKEIISFEDIKLLVRPKIETDIFETIDAIASKNKKRAIELMHKHLRIGDSPMYLLSMINYQLRNLIIIKELAPFYKSPWAISKMTGLHPYVVRKTLNLIDNFTIDQLKKIYQKIFQVDLAIKTGKIDSGLALDTLIAEI